MVWNSISAADRLHLVAQAQSVMASCNDCVAHAPQQQKRGESKEGRGEVGEKGDGGEGERGGY